MQTDEPRPRVTVFIAAYNAADTLGEAMDSVLAQTWSDFELLIVDDASIDATPILCRRYMTDSRVRVVRLEDNVGRAEVRNAGMARARGEYLAMLDADDRCMPQRLARQVAFLDAHPAIDVLGTWSHLIDDAGERRSPKKNQWRLTPDEVACWLLFRGIIHNPTIMARTDAMRGYRYDRDFPVAEDYDLWDRMRPQHGMALLPESLTEYRIHDGQASIARVEEGRERRRAIQARQLSALGMTFDDRDLRYHHLLYTGRRMFREQTGHAMDIEYVVWAEDWLRRLIAANRETRCYPEPAFARTAAALFFSVGRKAAKGGRSIRVGYRFLRSPLARRLPATWWSALRMAP